VDRLKRSYRDFLARAQKKTLEKKFNEEVEVNDENDTNVPRAPLQKLTTKQAASSARQGTGGLSATSSSSTGKMEDPIRILSLLGLGKPKAALPTKKSSSSSASNAGFAIFVDDEFASKEVLEERK
jgi:hypothetical protein